MARFRNGEVPLSELVKEGDNYFFPGTYRRWKNLVARVQREYGKTLFVTPRSHGASNAYRSLSEQVAIRNALGILASVPGYSSHGGSWSGQTSGRYGLPTFISNRESGAIDVNNWMEIGWENFKRAAEAEGFWVDVTVPREQWHIVDPNPWTLPAAGGGGSDELTEEEVKEILEQLSAMRADIAFLKNRDGGTTSSDWGGPTPTHAQVAKQVTSMNKRLGRDEGRETIGVSLDQISKKLDSISERMGRDSRREESIGVSIDRIAKTVNEIKKTAQ